jgi:DNA primase
MSMIVSILENFLGEPKTHYENKSQIGFDCPMCAQDKGKYDGDGKGNLAINYQKGVYKCWNCWERNNMHGAIPTLIRKYGTEQNLRDYLLVAPKNEYKKVSKDDVPDIVKLPETYRPFSKSNSYYTNHKEALDYVRGRGLTDEILNRFEIGYTVDGKRKDRIIIPSYSITGELNYYIARAFNKWNKFKYLNPEAKKELVVFNEQKVNWDATIYLVEGAFDHIVTPNSIPLLGKFISDKLFYLLQTKAKGDVILVLDGGEEEKKDAKYLYKKLNTLNLYNRVKVANVKKKMDLSLIYEKFGSKGIIKILRTAHKLKESRL